VSATGEAESPAAPTDCEVRDDWFLQQDVNAWTSLAYVGAAALLVTSIARRRLPPAFAALAGVTALEGLGSLLFHGSSGDLGSYLHDASLVGVLGFMAGWHVGRLAGVPAGASLVGVGVGSAAGAAAAFEAAATNGAVAIAGTVIVLAELVARRRHRPPVWTLPLLVLTGTAIAAWLAGSAGGPLCDPRSWAQPHGLWHVLTSVVVVVWAERTRAAVVGEA
jgi:hypothetical protein